MRRLARRAPEAQFGFSVLEIMVGVAIALIGIVVIFQVLTVWESRKRTTSSGSDAQIAGTVGMYNLERDLRQAGFGFGTSSYMGCTVNAYDATRAPTTNFTFGLYPVLITDGAGGAPDTLTVLWGNSALFSADQTFRVPTTPQTILPANVALSINTGKQTGNPAGFQKGDLAIAAGANPAAPPTNLCGLVEITASALTANNADGLTDGLSIGHVSGSYVNYLGNTVTARFNPTAANGLGLAYASGRLYDLGPYPQLNVWQIINGNTLAWSDQLHNATTWNQVAEGVINLQAEYGTATDTDGDGICEPAEAVNLTWGVAVPANWSCVRAIRVALLARGQQYENTPVTTTAPSWVSGSFVMTNVDGTTDTNPGTSNDWRYYRYRVYQAVVPLRNLIWGQCTPPACP